jgi:ribonuclease-3
MLDIVSFEEQIGYSFKDKILLKIALTHRSYLHEKERDPEITNHNERLEFLGDAVLELIVTEFLYADFPGSEEGYLTSLRAALVNYRNLGGIGKTLELETKMLLGRSEKGDPSADKLVLVANAMEALLGAIHLDGGYEPAKKFVQKYILPEIDHIIANKVYRDGKTEFQELVQRKLKVTPKYKIIESHGKDHEKLFVSGVFVGEKMVATGSGKSKQEAETLAAQEALKEMADQLKEEV